NTRTEGKMDPETLNMLDQPQSTIGDTLYKLHFFDQIPYAGRWIAGFVSLFFIFATLTGVLVHWKNIFTKFWAYGFKGTWKQIWTNAHTVFGMLGLPYQFMYAVTGAFYLLLFLVLMPTVILLYGGSPENVFKLAYPMYNLEYREDAKAADYTANIGMIQRKWEAAYSKEYTLAGIQANHLLREDAGVTYRMISKDPGVFFSNAYVGYRLKEGEEVFNSLPGNKKFTYKVIESLMHLHFASFGGLFVKAVYFVMALFSCFVFVSGVLIWKEARNNSRYEERQRRFHARVTRIFLAICFTLFPATAILFSAELLLPATDHVFRVNTVFFLSWLLLALGVMGLPSERAITRFSLWLGGLFSLLVPLVNGWVTGDWLWKTPLTQVWATDAFWLFTGLLSFSVYRFTCLRDEKTLLPGSEKSRAGKNGEIPSGVAQLTG
ncbi:MAG: PepSY domain-containing protein, partial [Leadbetterella sp.]|nr:PepSY domain-containing protein [Leadbetterella sp.]